MRDETESRDPLIILNEETEREAMTTANGKKHHKKKPMIFAPLAILQTNLNNFAFKSFPARLNHLRL